MKGEKKINPGIPSAIISILQKKKNLLGFSFGVDSTALFHLLRESGISFDMAMVNYGRRKQAREEELSALELAGKYGIKIHISHAPRWESCFELNARKFRYDFFESLIDAEGYDCLITGHQLNDRLEWMLMRLSRGAGAAEMAGMKISSLRQTVAGRKYDIIRPLLEVPRHSLESYLESCGYKYFLDESNLSEEHERSAYRPMARRIVERNTAGVVRSFRYLDRDRTRLEKDWKLIVSKNRLRVFVIYDSLAASRAADEGLKGLGYLLTAKERSRIDERESLVAGRKWAVELKRNHLYISPYMKNVKMPNLFRESCRKMEIPPKIRPYLFYAGIHPEHIAEQLQGP
jgi:tRNA(Ile)-lysidine synthase